MEYVRSEAKTTAFGSPPLAIASCSSNPIRKGVDADPATDDSSHESAGVPTVGEEATQSFLPWGYGGLYGIDNRVYGGFASAPGEMEGVLYDAAASGSGAGSDSVDKGNYDSEVITRFDGKEWSSLVRRGILEILV